MKTSKQITKKQQKSMNLSYNPRTLINLVWFTVSLKILINYMYHRLKLKKNAFKLPFKMSHSCIY